LNIKEVFKFHQALEKIKKKKILEILHIHNKKLKQRLLAPVTNLNHMYQWSTSAGQQCFALSVKKRCSTSYITRPLSILFADVKNVSLILLHPS
jgi:hypothetical protein